MIGPVSRGVGNSEGAWGDDDSELTARASQQGKSAGSGGTLNLIEDLPDKQPTVARGLKRHGLNVCQSVFARGVFKLRNQPR